MRLLPRDLGRIAQVYTRCYKIFIQQIVTAMSCTEMSNLSGKY